MKFKINLYLESEWFQDMDGDEVEEFKSKEDYYRYTMRKNIIEVLEENIFGVDFNHNIRVDIEEVEDGVIVEEDVLRR